MAHEETDTVFGPGTDLVISMFGVSLLLIVVLTGLFFDTVKSAAAAKEKVAESQSDASRLRRDMERVILDKLRAETDLAALRRQYADAERKLAMLQRQHADTPGELAALQRQYAAMERELAERKERGSDEVIPFPKDNENNFDSGRFELSPAFLNILEKKGILSQIDSLADKYGAERVIVEIFGYTDGEPLGRRASCTMDRDLVPFIHDSIERDDGIFPVPPTPCSNVDLGKLRADSVAVVISRHLRELRKSAVRVFGYSAGQTVLPGDLPTLASREDDGKKVDERRSVRVRVGIVNQKLPDQALMKDKALSRVR